MAPASSSRRTAAASSSGVSAKAGQAAVVGIPATSMLSFTAKGIPYSGSDSPASRRRVTSSARARASGSGTLEIHTAPSAAPSTRAHACSITSRGVTPPPAYASSSDATVIVSALMRPPPAPARPSHP